MRGMSDLIDNEWKLLYSNNPKIQAFAVCKDSQIIWQTHNLHQNLVNEVEQLTVAPSLASSSVSINGITYKRVRSSSESYLATAENNQGHFLMHKIEGRFLDTIILRDGRKIYGHIFAQILHRHARSIRQFQVHQTAIDEIVIRVVPVERNLRGRFKDNIVEALREYTGSLVHYSFEVVKEIKREKSGKHRHVKSDMAYYVD